MSVDAIAREGAVMLGSRLKRLAERLQAGAERMALNSGIPVQPSQMPIMASLSRDGPATVSELANRLGLSQPAITRQLGTLGRLDLVATGRLPGDSRSKLLSLTPRGQQIMDNAFTTLWPRLQAAVDELCDSRSLLAQVDIIEARLKAAPLDARPNGGLAIRRYEPSLAPLFRSLNEEWIEAMFTLEPADREVLGNPDDKIIAPGGDILFVEIPGVGIVGTCALKKSGENQYELTKMAVTEAARGRKAGEFLLKATIARAKALGAKRLYLLTNSVCEAAIHLYEKAGFIHDPAVAREFGSTYARSDVAMDYPIGS